MTADKSAQNRGIANFYREEFVKHKIRLESQKDFYADKVFQELETALNKIITEIDNISRMDQFSELASHLLAKIDYITHLSESPTNQNHRVH
jgi:hypothetical protein